MRSTTAVVVLVLCMVAVAVWGRRIPRWHLKMAQRQGPNTCAVEEAPDGSRKFFTECKYWMHRRMCGTRTIIRYECCEGFTQVEGQPGCSGVKPMTNLLQTAKELGATLFVNYIEEAGLADRLKAAGPAISMFVPTNEAIQGAGSVQLRQFEANLEDHLLYHMVPGRLYLRDQGAETMLQSLLGEQSLRLSRFGNAITTVNCKPLVRKDQDATNGVVHLIDGVLFPMGKEGTMSLPEILVEDGRFRELARLLLRSNLISQLRRSGSFTILTPSDEAFQELPRSFFQSISQDVNASTALLKNHIVPHTLCAPAIIDKHKVRTIGTEKLEVNCNGTGVYVDEARFTGESVFGNNGLLSVVTAVLIPDSVRPVYDLLNSRSERLSTFLSLLRDAGMENVLQLQNSTVTVFAPSDKAFEAMDNDELQDLTQDSIRTRELLYHHLVPGKVTTSTFSDNQKLPTWDQRNALRLKVYRKSLGVESAILDDYDIEGQNGILHIIDRVLVPPKESILELLERNDNFSTFAAAIRRVRDVHHHLEAPDDNRSYTVFAPTNEAFEQADNGKLKRLMDNKKHLKRLLQNHIVDNMMASGAFQTQFTYDIRTEYQTVKVHRKNEDITVNDAHVVKSDVLARDGIVHCIDNVLLPKDHT